MIVLIRKLWDASLASLDMFVSVLLFRLRLFVQLTIIDNFSCFFFFSIITSGMEMADATEHEWELSRENIRPLRSGRKVKSINNVFGG